MTPDDEEVCDLPLKVNFFPGTKLIVAIVGDTTIQEQAFVTLDESYLVYPQAVIPFEQLCESEMHQEFKMGLTSIMTCELKQELVLNHYSYL